MALDEEATSNFLKQVMDIWVNPEIERRSKAGKLPEPFILNSAQIIIYPDGKPNVVRLNKEVKAQLIAVANRSIKVNEVAPLEDMISEIREIMLTDRDDPNAGHVTFVKFNEKWNIAFDFRHNKKRADDRLNIAIQFLSSAKMNHEKELWRPFVDNMFSATELLATAQLLLHADKEYTKRQWHEGTERKYTAFVDMGNYKIDYKNTFLELSKLRKSARYRSDEFRFTKEEATRYLTVLDDMVEFTKKLLK